MDAKQQIKMALAYVGITHTELARRLGTAPVNLARKMKLGTLSVNDMSRIASAIGCEWKSEFEFPDGTMV